MMLVLNRRLLAHTAARAALVTAVVAALSACSKDTPDPRGTLDSTVDITLVTKAAIDASVTASGLAPLVGSAQCDVVVKRVHYQTIGGASEATTASGLVALPSGGANCDGTRPVVAYARGTDDNKTLSMADPTDTEVFAILATYAAQGYIVVAPSYTGYFGSSLSYHPYLVAEAQASDMVDALRAAKLEIAKQTRVKMGRLFVAGYSQGGHVAMATVRALERDFRVEFPLSGSMPMSGPYELSKFALEVIGTNPNQGATLFAPLLIDAYQASYKNIYTASSEVYQAPYATSAVGLLPGTVPAGSPAGSTPYTLALAQGKLPLSLKGGGGLLSDSFVANFIATGSTSKFLTALRANDVLNFAPRAAMNLCYGANDPVVYPSNSVNAVAYFKTLNITVGSFDLDSATAYSGSRDALRQAWQQLRATGGAAFVGQYHVAAVPFCLALSKSIFDEINAKP
jgi:pimeloyl-ACP methyl ester carboxylesterase